MRSELRLLIILAVLWCGLHLSPAEADEGAAHAATEAAFQDAGGGQDEHKLPHAAHACHSHCPVTPGVERAPALSVPIMTAPKPFPAPARTLHSLSQAPPVEPPSA